MEKIAIIGLGCRFPKANNPEAFWYLLRNGVDTVTEVPLERWNIDELYNSEPGTPGKICSRWGSFLDKVDHFDPGFFNISPREAERMDPQQRIFLEVAWEALEQAGLAPDKLAESMTGVFVGAATVNYDQFLFKNVSDLTQISAYDGIGTTMSVIANRLSYLLNLKGPSLAVETACSSSLVALHLACQSLRAGETNLCIVGGVNLILSPELNIIFSQAQMLSPDGRCKTFDASANGYVRGEGCGAVIIKRLSDAIRDEDNILAVVRGSALNQDGRSNGLTAPNGLSQQSVIRQALANAGVEPKQISYVETHGTGTSLGDPIEIKSLKAVLMEDRQLDQICWLGSVKTNIGHLEAAAGIASLIKTVLCIRHQEIPPHLHLNKLNPYIRIENTPLSISTELQKWSVNHGTRLAGVSSFGFGGTNAHVILEEPPTISETVTKKFERPIHLLTLSAKSETALVELAQRYEIFLGNHPTLTLSDICFTANVGRSHFDHRLATVVETTEQLRQQLRTFAEGNDSADLVHSRLVRRQHGKIAFLFTGQGSQYVGMGSQLYQTQPLFRKTLDHCDEILRPYLKQPLLEVLYPQSGQDSLIHETAYTQPALFALEYALAQLWLSWGIKPTAVMGHSVGEYVAACVAGVFCLEEGLHLIAERGRLMQELPPGGKMVALMTSEGEALEIIAPYHNQVAVAAINGPQSTVISGSEEAIDKICCSIASRGIKTKPLQVSHAFHSPLMEPILGKFASVAATVNYHSPRIAVISNVSGEQLDEGLTKADYWVNHLRQPVRFADGIQTLCHQGYEVFLEIGPKPILLGMGLQNLPEGKKIWLPTLRPPQKEWQQLLASLAQLYIEGVSVDWSRFDDNYIRHRLDLPTYPYQRKSYWVGKPQTAHLQSVSSSTGKPSVNAKKELSQESLSPPTAILEHDWQNKRRELLVAEPETRSQLLQSYLAELLATVMKISPSDLNWRNRLSELGFDSLMAAELRRKLETSLEIDVPVEFLAELTLEEFLKQLLFLIDQQHLTKDKSRVNEAFGDEDFTRLSPKPEVSPDDLWIIRSKNLFSASFRLFCFPSAGADGSFFGAWSKYLPEIELCPIQLPGRGTHLGYPPFTRLTPLIQTLSSVLKNQLDLPFAFFGHSLGALVSFELARELRRQNLPLPSHLLVSASKSPQIPDLSLPIHTLPDIQFLEKLKEFNGITPEVLQDNELMQQFLPALRSDFAILETYVYASEKPLPFPISAFGGTDDQKVSKNDLAEWSKQTEKEFSLQMFSGGHFFLHTDQSGLIKAISEIIQPLLFN